VVLFFWQTSRAGKEKKDAMGDEVCRGAAVGNARAEGGKVPTVLKRNTSTGAAAKKRWARVKDEKIR
jgi:hypothetical protein